MKKLYEYSSNNSGGSWWLSDEDWINLEKAGWYVWWGGPNATYDDRKCVSSAEAENNRWLDALATRATKEFESEDEAIEDFERITGENYYSEGCECCGSPHGIYGGVMKAYYIDIKDDPDQGAHIVWDTSVKNAKKRVNESDLYYESWIDVQCRRYPAFDGFENLTKRELALEQWHNAWWFDSDEPSDDGEHTDEEFLAWYDRRHNG